MTRMIAVISCRKPTRSCFLRRRELALKHQGLSAEKGLLSSKVQKAEAANKEGASAARDDEARVLKDHQVRCLLLVHWTHFRFRGQNKCVP